jgi:hypothetical protein
MAISFTPVGSFQGTLDGPNVITNPTSLQFGPDGRLYVSEQNGAINAFEVSLEAGQYVASSHEVLELDNGLGVVQGIQNHNDDGSLSSQTNRQVTGILVAGTAENPVLYISSSDPRISSNGEVNLDTNSGVLTQATWTGTEWEAVDLIRGLPRSEENHSTNGMVLSEDGTTLYMAVGGNTNNGAPSQFFSYTGEYVLSGAILEIDLIDLASRPVLTDADAGQGGTARQYVYDLPTLDDPSVPNDGVREDTDGLDVNGPFGGNDGFNMAVLPADAPIRIYADGLRNPYDLAFGPNGQLYTVDNGSNGNLGGDPIIDNGEATQLPNNGGSGEPEPLFLLEDGGYYGHPNPARSNQDLAWTVYDNSGNPDGSVSPNTVSDLSALVPDSVDIQEGFLIDPSKFTDDPARLLESGIRVPRNSVDTNALVTVGSSSNGLIYYDSNGTAFDGALDGSLMVTQFNDNITVLNLTDDGTAVEALIDPGSDGLLGTADDFVPTGAGDGTYQLPGFPGNLTNPLDLTIGPNGTIWVAEIGSNDISVWAPSGLVLPNDTDFDNDGLENTIDPFTRDPDNGTAVVLEGGETYLWSFAASGTGNDFPGPDGYGGGLTGVMVNGTTDFEQFFQEPSDDPEQDVNLDNVKFNTAAAGGATVIEKVSNGDPFQGGNSGEFLFHTGVKVGQTVATFDVKWTMLNPGDAITGNFQQIGGYIGTGDQSNYLKVVAISGGGNTPSMQISLEDGDSVVAGYSQALPQLFDVTEAAASPLVMNLLVDVAAQTATPTISYELPDGTPQSFTGAAVSLAGSAVMEAILGNASVGGQETGLAVGLFSSNNGEPEANTFQAVFDDIEITTTEAEVPPVAGDDVFLTGVNEPLEIPVADLLANDSDQNTGDTVTVTGVTSGTGGTAVLDDNGTAGDTSDDKVVFTPGTDFEGLADFTYTIEDGTGLTDEGNASVTVSDQLVLYRVNAGGGTLAALDDGPDWSADTSTANSPFLIEPGQNNTNGFSVLPGVTVPSTVPAELFLTERWDAAAAPEMQWGFDVDPGLYEVRIFAGNGFSGTSTPGTRVYDISIEGDVPSNLNDIDLSSEFGHTVGVMLTSQVFVTDGTLNIEFLHEVENPLVNGIEIVRVSGETPDPVVSIISGNQSVGESDGQLQISFATDITVPAAETLEFTFQIIPGSATPGVDYEYNDTSAVFDPVSGIYTDTVSIAGSSSDATRLIDILPDADIEGSEAFSIVITEVTSGNGTIGNASAEVTILDDDTAPGTVLFRINSGGPEVTATDGGPNWSADTGPAPTPFLVAGGENTFGTSTAITVDPADVNGAPAAVFDTERWDPPEGEEMAYEFSGLAPGDYTVNLYMVEGSGTQSTLGARQFDVAVEGVVPTVFDNITPFDTYGNAAFVLSFTTAISDGVLDLDFLHGAVNNPAIRGIEILTAGDPGPQDTVDGTPVPGGDFSSVPDAPTAIVLPEGGSTTITTNLEGGNGDRDFVTVVVPEGFRLVDVVLDAYDADPSNSAFLGLKLGGDFTTNPPIPALGVNPDGTVEPGDLNGGYIYNAGDIGADLLPSLNDTSSGFAGFDEDGLTGEVTFWFNQGGDASSATLTFVTEALPEALPIVAAINAGGPALSQDGIDFAADNSFLNGTPFADGNAGNGQQPVFDGTIYETERYGGASGSAAGPLAYEIAVDAGDYQIELHFAEIFQSTPGTRVFDVLVEGQLVLDDFDILAETGGDFNQPVVLTLPDTFSPDTFGNPDALDIDFSASIDNAKISGIVVRDATAPPPSGGAATLTVNNGANDIEASNFGNGSFTITNVGTKDIAFIEIDVTDALFPDAVFDPFGLAGDLTAKILTLNGGSDGGTGLVVPSGGFGTGAEGITYIGTGGTAGFEKIRLDFTDFNPGDTISFGVDMDPNSIAGAQKTTLDSGAGLAGAGGDAKWDVGGIGGAELAGGLFTVGYSDGTGSTGQLQGQGNGQQMGATALSSQDSPNLAVTLTVNGLAEGSEGTYSDGGPQILIEGPAGQTARVLVAKGFIVPFSNEFATTDPYKAQLDAQLAALEASGFPANNAVEMLYVDVALDGTVQDISGLFDFTQVAAFDLSVPDAGNEFGVLDEAKLPLGIVASVIDTATDQSLGPVTSPIHLTFAENAPPEIDPIADVTINEGQTVQVDIAATDAEGDPIALSVTLTRDIDGTEVDPADYAFTDNGDGTGSFSWLTGEPDDGAYTLEVTADDGTGETTVTAPIIVNEVPDPAPGTILYRVNAGGDEVAAADGGPAWTADTAGSNSPFLVNAGSNNTFPTTPDTSVDMSLLAGTGAVPEMVGKERWDNTTDAAGEMAWAFDVLAGTEVTVRLYLAELFAGLPDLDGSSDPTGDRVFDVAVDGVVPAAFQGLDPYSLAGNAFNKGSVVSHTLTSDGTIDLEFLHVSENTAIKGIEIVVAGTPDTTGPDATLDAADVGAAATSYQFAVTFDDASGIDVSTLDDLDITVSNGAIAYSTTATLVSVDVPADGAPRTATYEIVPPGGGWTPDDNGTYSVVLNDGEVADLLGNATGETILGTFDVALPVAAAGALVAITPGGSLDASTFGASSFQVTNTSDAGVQIVSVSINLATGILPDMVFDPTGAGGDATASAFTPNVGAAATGLVAPADPAVDPFSQPRNGGFDVLDIAFTDFDPAEQFFFTTDVDPNSIQGVAGAGNAGAVSGYELIGATVTVTFSNGETLVGSILEDGSLGGGQATLGGTAPAAPTIEVLGGSDQVASLPGDQVEISGNDFSVLVTGTPGAEFQLLQMDTRLYIASGDAPFDVTAAELPFYANEAMSGQEIYTGTLDGSGIAIVSASLIETAGAPGTPNGGLNYLMAVVSEGGVTSKASAPLVVKAMVTGPDYSGFNEVAASGYTRGTSQSDLYIFGTDYADVPSSGGSEVDAYLLTALSDSKTHRVRDYEPNDVIDLSQILGFQQGDDPNDYVRLSESRGNTIIEVDLDGAANGASFQAALLLTNITGLDLGMMLANGTLYIGGGAGGPANTDPVLIVPPTASVAENETAVLAAQATDADGDTPEFSISGGADGALFEIDAATGALSFVVPPDFEAPSDAGGDNVYEVEILVSDGNGGSDSGLVAVTVTDVNEVPNEIPVADDLSVTIDEDTGVSGTVTASDGDGDALEYGLAFGPANGVATVDPDGSFSYTPDEDFFGTDSFEFLVGDGKGGFDTGTVSVTVDPVNDDPVLSAPAAVSIEEGATEVLTATATDADGDVPAFSISGGADAGLFEIDGGSGVLSFLVPPDFEAPGDADGDNVYDVEISVSDGNGGSASQSVSVTVTDGYDGVGPDYSGFNEIAASGYTRATSASDLFIFDLTYADVPGSGGSEVDAYLLTALSDSKAHRVRDFEANDIVDLSQILGFRPGDDPNDYVRLSESRGNTTIEVDIDGTANGASFEAALLLTGITGLDLDTMLDDGLLYI